MAQSLDNIMTPKFLIHEGENIAMIPKSGSSAIARAILFAQQPDYTVRSASGDQSKVDLSLNRPKWQALVGKTEQPVSPIIPIRDPVERFRSACAQEGKTAEEALAKCESGDFSGHFKPTVDWLIVDSQLYKFPEQLDDIAAALGLSDIPSVNDSALNNGPKPDLTPEQLVRVQAIYADDIALFESITEAGQSWTAPPTPPEPVYVPASVTRRQFFLELDAQGIESVLDGFVALADRRIQIEYATAATFDRTWPALNAAIPMLDAFDTERTWDDAFVDTLFIGAAKR